MILYGKSTVIIITCQNAKWAHVHKDPMFIFINLSLYRVFVLCEIDRRFNVWNIFDIIFKVLFWDQIT